MSENEDNPDYWINMAYSLQREGKPEKAQKYYEEALKLDPENVVALINLSSIETREKRGGFKIS
jgi:tetratricopeptide (TPR) repeat protein